MAEFDLDLGAVESEARAAAYSFDNLLNVVKGFGRQHGIKGLVIDLKQARSMLQGAGNNIEVVKASLKGAGVSGRDTTLVVRQLNKELDKSRMAALSASSVFKSFWSTDGITNYLKHLRGVNLGFSAVKKLAGGAAGVASWGIEKGEHVLDKVLEVAQFKEASIKGLEYIAGKRELRGNETAEEAARISAKNERATKETRELWTESLKLAQNAPISDREIVSAIKDFRTQGYSAKEAVFVAKVMADQQSKFLEDPSVKENFKTAFNRGQGRGQANNRDLESLRIAKFKQSEVLEELINQPGMEEVMKNYKGGKYSVSDDDIKRLVDEMGESVSKIEGESIIKLKKILSSGLVDTSTLQNAAIATLYKGENLDTAAGQLAAMKAKTTLTGAVNNAQNAFENLLLSMDNAESKGGTALKEFLNNYTKIIGHSSKLKNTITGLINALLEPLNRIKPEDMEHVIDTIGMLGKGLIGFFERSWKWLDKLIHAEPGEFLSNVKDVLIDVGDYIGQGIYTGFKTASGFGENIEGRTRALAKEKGYSTDEYLKQQQAALAPENYKPSWVERGYAMFGQGPTPESIASHIPAKVQPSYGPGGGSTQEVTMALPAHASGLDRVPGTTGQPYAAVLHGGERVVPASQNTGSGGTNGPTINVNLAMMYSGNADADSLEAAIEPVAMRVFRNVWERMAMEVGG